MHQLLTAPDTIALGNLSLPLRIRNTNSSQDFPTLSESLSACKSPSVERLTYSSLHRSPMCTLMVSSRRGVEAGRCCTEGRPQVTAFKHTRYNATRTDSRAPRGRNSDTKKAQWPTSACTSADSFDLPWPLVYTTHSVCLSFKDRHTRTTRLPRVSQTNTSRGRVPFV